MAGSDLGVAVVGCGSTAHRRHLPVWAKHAGCRLVAVVSRDAARRESAAREYGVPHALADWHDLAHMADVQIVDICTPHPTHAEIACALAAAGKHVLCEKPLAVRPDDARRMVEAARSAGVVLLPFHNMRLLGAARQAVQLVREGAIGRPRLIRGVMAHAGPDARDPRRLWFLEATAGGGAVLDLGPHLFDLTAALVGEAPTRIRACMRKEPDDAVERDASVDMVFPGGASSHFLLSWSMAGGRETQLVVHGERGVLRLALGQEPPVAAGAPHPLSLGLGGHGAKEVLHPDPADSLEPCDLMLRAVRGEAVPLSAEDGLRAVTWVDAVYRSAAQDGAWCAP